MEIFGGSDETYLARKLDKAAYYDRMFWRHGVVALGRDGTKHLENIPALPPAARPTA